MIRRHLKVIFSVMVNVFQLLVGGHSNYLTVFIHRDSRMTRMRRIATNFFFKFSLTKFSRDILFVESIKELQMFMHPMHDHKNLLSPLYHAQQIFNLTPVRFTF
ncbi:hypothetical protein ACKWTF_009307 [Chironomus riparius]